MDYTQPLHKMNPVDVNPYVVALIHSEWKFFSDFFIICEKRYSTGPSRSLNMIVCQSWIKTNKLRLNLYHDAGMSYRETRAYCYFDGYAGDYELSKIEPLGHMLAKLRIVYSGVNRRAELCYTNVYEPTAHDVADAISTVSLINKWRIQSGQGESSI